MTERMFAIQRGPDVPWRLVEPHRKQAEYNHDQTLERLHERAGLSPGELRCAVEGRRLDSGRMYDVIEEDLAWLKAWLADDGKGRS